MAQTVLDRVRDVVLDERRKGSAQPRPARGRVYVTPSGRVVIGDEVEPGEDRMLSEVHPAVFA
ncbi:MAG TPA: hypothetical protein VF912_05730 [Anaeromyxobacter sp.]